MSNATQQTNNTTDTEPSDSESWVVGIDLGTTNSAVAYADIDAAGKVEPIQPFEVPQLTDAGVFSRQPVLPSFLYIPGQYDIESSAMVHPWPRSEDDFVGAWARDQGAQVPTRLVASAKSWLCHDRVDRHARILPWGAPGEVRKVSPVRASAAYLEHIRKAWNHSRGNEEEYFLENQTVIVTVPASFDEVARELTLAAAKMAGYGEVILLEEPLAAFYSWLVHHERRWDQLVQPGQLILICDVGGGTTDFTLVTLTAEAGGSPRFERIAVGDHLLLGGDNMDLALARLVESQWHGNQQGTLDSHRWQALCHQCRQAKERILSGEADTHRVTLMGSGSRLIAGTMSANLDRTTIERTILEGFFPIIDSDDERPATQRAAISEFGLPYEPEPAVTRHLMRFLEHHREEVGDILGKTDPMPDLVLFNGGALVPEAIQQRIIDAVCRWFGRSHEERPGILENRRHDLAVGQGAAYYGLVKTGRGVRVGSGSPRSYYLGVANPDQQEKAPQQAICLVERGLDEGSAIALGDRQFQVLANQPVRFDLYSSSFRSRDRMGGIVEIDDTFMQLPPLQTVIQYGKRGAKIEIPVAIEAHYTEMGTLSLWCRSQISDHRWQLQFQLRDAMPETELREEIVLEDNRIAEARQLLEVALKSADQTQLDGVVKQIAATVDLPRDKWPMRLLRELADLLIDNPAARTRSPAHEARWMNLTGYCLRPGFGDSLDPDRIKRTWKIYNQGPAHPRQNQVQNEWWIMWRRLAGGLNPGQQRQLSQDAGRLLQSKKGKKPRLPAQLQIELWMAIANLERLYVKDKIQWGRLLLTQITPKQIRPQHLWSLSRIGARALLYGSTDRVVPPQEASRWIENLLKQEWPNTKAAGTAMAQLARKTGDRTRDLEDNVVKRLAEWMAPHNELEPQQRLLTEVVPIARHEEQTLFGESLPAGLILGGEAEPRK